MRYFAFLLALLASASAWAQTPPTPNPSPSPQSTATPQPQSPVTQLYRLVPVQQPALTPQYQTVQLAQHPIQYQTVQLAQQPVCPTSAVQLVQQPVQVSYVPSTQTTFGVSSTGQRTVVLGPGLVSLSLARVGQSMVNTFGKTHVWNISHSVVRPQPQPSPPVQLVTVSTPAQQPAPPVQVQLLQQPQQPTYQQQYKINAPSEDAPPPPVVPTKPSAQSSHIPPPKSHRLFGLLGS